MPHADPVTFTARLEVVAPPPPSSPPDTKALDTNVTTQKGDIVRILESRKSVIEGNSSLLSCF